MINTKLESDFTVPVSYSEKAATALAIAILSGGLLFILRKFSLSDAPASVAFNFFFAVGLLGSIRLTRLGLEQKRRGLIIKEDTVQVNSLLFNQEIPISEISDKVIICAKDQKKKFHLTFLWGQNRFRLPCAQADSLAQVAQSRGLRVLMASSEDLELRNLVEKIQNQKTKDNSNLKFSGSAIFAFSLWMVGILGLTFFS